jgi:hypothetical protein
LAEKLTRLRAYPALNCSLAEMLLHFFAPLREKTNQKQSDPNQLYLCALNPSLTQMLQAVAPLLLEMLHLKSIIINDVADVAPFPTSHIFLLIPIHPSFKINQ